MGSLENKMLEKVWKNSILSGFDQKDESAALAQAQRVYVGAAQSLALSV